MSAITLKLAESGHVDLPFPAPVFGLIALALFFVLAIVVWSYRDVADRHSQKTDGKSADHGHGH